jgi:hypothetical protein
LSTQRSRKSAHHRHSQIQNDQIRPLFEGLANSLFPIYSLSANLNIRPELEDTADIFADDVAVIYDGARTRGESYNEC